MAAFFPFSSDSASEREVKIPDVDEVNDADRVYSSANPETWNAAIFSEVAIFTGGFVYY
ncbi:hypothetical protein J4226_02140 [Candidatus Pacearchaeota archaeon]|nr:hypothetical protein [Candidatus Pacearchaeota archaeon]